MFSTKLVIDDVRRMNVVLLQPKESALRVHELEEALKQQRVALAEFEQKTS